MEIMGTCISGDASRVPELGGWTNWLLGPEGSNAVPLSPPPLSKPPIPGCPSPQGTPSCGPTPPCELLALYLMVILGPPSTTVEEPATGSL